MPPAWEAFKSAFGAPPPDVNKWRVRGEAEEAALTDARAALIHLDIDDVDDLLDDAQELIDKLQDGMELYDGGSRKEKKTAVSELKKRVGQAEKLHKELRAALRQADPADIMVEHGGPQLLDLMMEDVKWSKAKTADKDFAIAAIKARFNLPEFVTPRDKTEKKALPMFYRALRMLPESHTLGNDSLLSFIQRAAPEQEGDERFAGVYTSSDQRIVTHLDQILGGKNDNDMDKVVPKAIRPTGKMPNFAHTTLHEVGHAVDDKHGIMGTDNDDARAGWRQESVESTAAAIGAHHNFFADFPGLPDAWLAVVLMTYASSGAVNQDNMGVDFAQQQTHAGNLPPLDAFEDLPGLRDCEEARADRDDWPEDESGLKALAAQAFPYANAAKAELVEAGYDSAGAKRASHFFLKRVTEQIFGFNRPLDEVLPAEHAAMASYAEVEAEELPWEAIEDHPAVAVMKAIFEGGFKGSQGFYNAGRAGAVKAKVGARTYTVDNNQKWWSYLFAKRAEGVSQYQFNAPAEWFSELYALYYGGKLPDQHPARPLLAAYDH